MLQQLLSEDKSFREIAKILGRSPPTIRREIKEISAKRRKDTTPGAQLRYISLEDDDAFVDQKYNLMMNCIV
jgi:IS30 family transposase